jgi:hypothetical protein
VADEANHKMNVALAGAGWAPNYKLAGSYGVDITATYPSVLDPSGSTGRVVAMMPVRFLAVPDNGYFMTPFVLGDFVLDLVNNNGVLEWRWPGGGMPVAQVGANTTLDVINLYGQYLLEVELNGAQSKLRIDGTDVATMNLSGIAPATAFGIRSYGNPEPRRGDWLVGGLYVSAGYRGDPADLDLLQDSHINAARTAIMAGMRA